MSDEYALHLIKDIIICMHACMHPLLLLGIGKGDDLTDTSDEVRAMKRGRG